VPHDLPIRVRYADTDAQGHVFFANLLTYFDEGLTAYLEAIGCPYASLLAEEGVDLVYAESLCRYREPTRFGDDVRVRVQIAHMGKTSIRSEIQVLRGETVLAEGHLISVCVDKENLQKAPLPRRMRDAVMRFESA
jgi:acyl-CoA thioester hydrolase